jgi:F-type H+-transporting ATPase subunit alpha
MTIEQEVIAIYAGTQGYLDDIAVTRVLEFQDALLAYVDASAPTVRQGLAEKKELTSDLENQLKETLKTFKSTVWKK